jgi:antitoxin (DNA-binding transcriptional repressor) of toxin-antitoxin stability system
MDSKRVEITEATFDLLLSLEKVAAGQELILTRNGISVARMSPLKASQKDRVPGSDKGLFVVPDDFDDPLPPEIQRYFDGEGEDWD